MDSADGLFHDRGETDADELALVVVGLVDKGLVLADEEWFLDWIVSCCVGLFGSIDIGMQHFGTGKRVFRGFTSKGELNVFGRDALSDIS
jgi:hypothetical protein